MTTQNGILANLKLEHVEKYDFDELKLLVDVGNYIDSTYSKHYTKDQIQALEVIFDAGYGKGFCLGNIIKYAKRYGKKNGWNRDDIMKMIHYGILLLHAHDREHGDKE